MEEENVVPYCVVTTITGKLSVRVNLEDGSTVGYAKAIACSAWGITELKYYALTRNDKVWHESCVIPTKEVHTFCLQPFKTPGSIKYTWFNSKFEAFDPLSDEERNSHATYLKHCKQRVVQLKPDVKALYDALATALRFKAELCRFSGVYSTDDRIVITVKVIDLEETKAALRVFHPRPQQTTFTPPNLIVLFFEK